MNLRERGMTMVELLVAMAIGVSVTLAVATMLVAGENQKRTTTSSNDADQTASYAFYAIERYLRSAGSAIAQSAYVSGGGADAGVLGCKLNAGTFLPRATAFPIPFENVLAGATSSLRVAPVLIAHGQSENGDDALIIMGGAGTGGGVSRPLISTSGSSPTGTVPLPIESSEGFQAQDYVLVSQSGLTTPGDCLLEEVYGAQSATAPTPPLPVVSSASATFPYVTQGGSGTAPTLSTLATTTSTYVTGLGNVLANDLQYQMIGVSANKTLYGYDLLQYQTLLNGQTTDASQAIADGVVAMYAIYGVSTTTPGVFGEWVSPGDANAYDITTVMNSEAIMKTIVAVRVALVVRGEYYDKNVVSPSSLTLFRGLVDGSTNASLAQSVNLAATQQHYRYRTVEFTVPLRNMLILAGTS